MSTRKIGAAAIVTAAAALTAAPAGAATPATVTRAAFTRVASTARVAGATPTLQPRRFAAYRVDTTALGNALDAAPALRGKGTSLTISLPTPEGAVARFAVRQTSVMEAGLAAAHPEIRTFAGRSLDVPGSEVHLELTPIGLTAAVRGGGGSSYYIDPQYEGDASRSVVYERDALGDPRPEGQFVERELGDEFSRKPKARVAAARAAGDPVTLKTYRLALLSDPSYARNNGAGGNTTAAKAVLMDRVNQLYESDLAIHMILINATDKLDLDTDAQATGANGPCGEEPCYQAPVAADPTDPTDQGTPGDLDACSGTLLDRNIHVAGLLAGARNFDIGHIVLGKNGGGIAGLGVVGTATKAEGCTGIPRPVGDYFAVDYVAHEMGHEFGGNHTFDGDQLNCSAGNRNAFTGVEPGSGTTVMAYAGICAQDNLQSHSDPYFSQRSIDEITDEAGLAEDTLSSVQQTAFTNLDGTDAYRLTYAGQSTTPLTAASTAAQIKAALQLILPAGGTVDVGEDQGAGSPAPFVAPTTVPASGYPVAFGGTLADTAVALLGVTAFTGNATGFVGELQAGGPTTMQGSPTVTTNHVPTVTTAAGFTIPRRTPFKLTATGSDADAGDHVTYLWEQNDTAPAEPFLGTGQGTLLVSNTKSFGPLFRVFGTAARYPEADVYLSPSPGENQATSDPTRELPDVQQVMADNTNALTGSCPTVVPNQYNPGTGELVVPGDPVSASVADCYSEFLPTAGYGGDGSGAMHFRVTARDNHPATGGVNHADTTLTLAPGRAPFRITAPAKNVVYPVGGKLPVTWDVAGTDTAPISTAQVRISLSTDGGATFPTVLAAATPNDGTEELTLPAGVKTENGRIRIDAVGNVFYDASRGTITIADSSAPAPGAGASGATGGTDATGTSPAAGGTSTGGGTASGGGAPAGGGAAAGTTTPGPAGTKPAATTGGLKLFRIVGRSIGRPVTRRAVVLAVCAQPSCTISATALLSVRSRKTGKLRRTRLSLGTRKLARDGRGTLTLTLTAARRRAISAARSASVVITTTSAGKRATFSYRFTVG